ncbi:tumor necrosis factor receptor superfamily member 6-like [Saccostrea echinata]|uniref:tumor necrosis factor receptor superfamily member 6-like n=1 Tax=Saccostrea echinata TaxID=191078 RepID=UPI002A841AD3|nr:tumor necrosis factor receptor superfamily member 6-like [Saccostrea echinata]
MASLYVSATGLLCIMCEPGTYKEKDCVINMTTATCAECPEGTFQKMTNDAEYCANCLRFCADKNQVILEPCTKTSDTKCRCRDGFYFKTQSADGTGGYCFENNTEQMISTEIPITRKNVTICGNNSIFPFCNNGRGILNSQTEEEYNALERVVITVVPVISLLASLVGFLFLIVYYTRNSVYRTPRLKIPEGIREPLRDEEWRILNLFVATQAFVKKYKTFLRQVFELSGEYENIDSIIWMHESNHPNNKTEVVFESLQTWRQKLNRKASVDVICAALSRAGCKKRVVQMVLDKHKEIVDSRVKPPALRRSQSCTEGCLLETAGPIAGKSVVEMSAYI